jgi:hypothetical protein
MKTFKAFKQGKLFEMTQQGDRIVVTIYDTKASTVEQALSGNKKVLGAGSIVLWDKLIEELETA